MPVVGWVDLLPERRDLEPPAVLSGADGPETDPDHVSPLGPALEHADGLLWPCIGGEVELSPRGVAHHHLADRPSHQEELVAGRAETLPKCHRKGVHFHQRARRHGIRAVHAEAEDTLSPFAFIADG